MQGLQAGRGLTGERAVAARLESLDWEGIERALGAAGHATTGVLLDADGCAGLRALYGDDRRFRSRVDMARFRFGEGEYKYFAEPLPPVVATLRAHAYARLAPIANQWAKALGSGPGYPATLAEFRRDCAAQGQTRPTPLLLCYTTGGYNCLHQDLYGAVAFPFQMTIVLSRPGVDFTGGEFLLVEQRPRAQSRGDVVALAQGEAVIFATRHRPAPGARGFFRTTLRHGVSRLRSGERLALGIIFHDAE
ncbi:MAG: 2OG-Fe(II) oxygenase [Candidatus Rokubacteria bacterium]|nr:2OG-Fe(II) oxygenase [Candidatus Rokubacteria bacterium]